MRQNSFADSSNKSRNFQLISRRTVIATTIVPFGSLVFQQSACSVPASPQQHRFELAFEYKPASSNTPPETRRVHVPVVIHAPATLPVRPSPAAAPIVIFSPGFLQSSSSYGIFLAQLLATGCNVVIYDKSFEQLSSLVDDVESSELLRRVAAEVAARLRGPDPASEAAPCFLVGHSRGAKLSVLAAAMAPPALRGTAPTEAVHEPVPRHQPPGADSPVSGLVLLDPADGAFEAQDPGRFPSALPLLRNQPVLADVPVLLLGAGRGGDCVPRGRNYAAFFDACRGPRALVTLRDVGHLQFLDPSNSLAQSLCAAGRGVRNEQVAAASGRLAAAYIRSYCVAGAADGEGASWRAWAATAESPDGGQAAAATYASRRRGTLLRLCREGLADSGLRYEVQVSAGDDSDRAG